MTPALYGLLERVHGHAAMLGLAVLLHPVLALRRKGLSRGMRWSLGLAGALIAGPTLLGWVLYPTYRSHVKPTLVQESLPVALAFESKEHLAFVCLALTLSGVCVGLLSARSRPAQQVAWALLTGAWGCGLLAGALGIWVAAVAQPGW